MATAYSDLCRLCARRNEFSKDLLDKNNKNMLDLIHQFMQIAITENDNLPTKVCLDCEEKMVSFQLYILQCYKVQDYLNEVCLENKVNVDIQFCEDVKAEVKKELTTDDIFNVINDDSIAEFGDDAFQNDDDSDIDDITIASLKQKKSRQIHDTTQLAIVECNRVLNKSILDISDIVKLECTNCVTPLMSWGDLCSHYAVTHDTTPIAHCLCGHTVNSSSALNKHFMWHKKLNNEVTLDKIEGVPKDSINQEGDNEDETPLISLKQEKKITEEEKTQLNQLLQNPALKVKDIIKFTCSFCETSLKSWSSLSSHYEHVHKSSPRATCLCGYIIRSAFTLHKHYASHKKNTPRKNSKQKGHKSKDYDALLRQAKLDRRVQNYVQFTCIHCNKEYSSWYKLKSHTERVHKVPPEVFCLSCGLAIKSKSVMYKHVKDHNNPTELSCDQCSLRCKSLEALNKHKLKHIPKAERKFECSNCDKVFPSKDALKSHLKSHLPLEERKVYQCDKCEMRFTSKSAVTSHARVVHEKIKSFVCDNCGYACGTSGELRQHVAIHSDDRPFVCKTCSKPFKTYANLKTHEDTHGETSYACFICNRILNSRRTLRKHLLVHDDKCRHVCSYCNKAFKRRQTLKVHMFTHTGDKPLTCKWCDERFSYASTLRSHRLRCHPDKMTANDGGSSFQYIMDVQKSYAKDDRAAISVGTNES